MYLDFLSLSLTLAPFHSLSFFLSLSMSFFLLSLCVCLLIHCRAQAIAIGQALVDGRWLDCVTHNDQLFRDEYALYRPLQVTHVYTLCK